MGTDKELYKIKWSSKADEDFDRILDYLSEEWPAYVSENFMRIVERKVSVLSGQPLVGKKIFKKLKCPQYSYHKTKPLILSDKKACCRVSWFL